MSGSTAATVCNQQLIRLLMTVINSAQQIGGSRLNNWTGI